MIPHGHADKHTTHTQTHAHTPTHTQPGVQSSFWPWKCTVFEGGESDHSFWLWQRQIQPAGESGSEPNYLPNVGGRTEWKGEWEERRGLRKRQREVGVLLITREKSEPWGPGAVNVPCRWRMRLGMCWQIRSWKKRSVHDHNKAQQVGEALDFSKTGAHGGCSESYSVLSIYRVWRVEGFKPFQSRKHKSKSVKNALNICPNITCNCSHVSLLYCTANIICQQQLLFWLTKLMLDS